MPEWCCQVSGAGQAARTHALGDVRLWVETATHAQGACRGHRLRTGERTSRQTESLHMRPDNTRRLPQVCETRSCYIAVVRAVADTLYHRTMVPTSLHGFHSPAASTEAPLEMLAACHGRVAHQCNTLGRLAAHLPDHGSDTAARQAATAVMRYFDTAARDHHADEEEDLFPALLEAMAGSDAVCVRALTDSLRIDHRTLEALWHDLRESLSQIANGQAVDLPAAQVQAFVTAYTRHIEKEDAELLPLATRLLSDADIARVGKAMRVRRGIFLPD